jgi:cell division protein ZapB
MISEFHQLVEKISELAALTQALRRENAGLRVDNAELKRRMDEAHQRVTALLEKMPAPMPDEEAV